ncbi:MAG: PucC family protein, partial [Pseudomonadota bacterium]
LLEPYGGHILNLGVSDTTTLTALLALGSLLSFAVAARDLSAGGDACRLAAFGVLAGIPAFGAVIFAAPVESAALFRVGTFLIGFGAGLFAVGTLTAAMDLAADGQSGLALGAWGAVQATSAGIAIAAGGAMRDIVSVLSEAGTLGPALAGPSTGYSFVYHFEIALLFATLIAIGPLVRMFKPREIPTTPRSEFGLAQMPG